MGAFPKLMEWKKILHKDREVLNIETPQHWVWATNLLIYLNAQKGLEALLPLVWEKCIVFGNENENFYKERIKVAVAAEILFPQVKSFFPS